MFTSAFWWWMLVLAGIGQLVLIVGSLAIPKVLNWQEELAPLSTLTRQMFWVYSGYIWGTNLSFGLVSAFAPGWLLDGSPLAGAVCGFITVYWGARVVIQFAYFDLSSLPPGIWHRLAKWCLDLLFVALTMLYGALCVMTLTQTMPR